MSDVAIQSDVAEFHHKIWNNPDALNEVFKLTPIERGDPRANVQIPDQCLVNPHQEVDTSMDTSVGVAESSAGLVAFPTSIDNPFLDKNLRDKPKQEGVAICGSPGTGEHNYLGREGSCRLTYFI